MLKPYFKIEYNNKDITKDVSKYVTNIEYTDFESGESDEINITFEDSEKLWQGTWIPIKGDALRVFIGYVGEKLLNCGIFEIDEIEYSASSDSIIVNQLIQDMSAYATEQGLTISSVEDVRANAELMTMINNAWTNA